MRIERPNTYRLIADRIVAEVATVDQSGDVFRRSANWRNNTALAARPSRGLRLLRRIASSCGPATGSYALAGGRGHGRGA